MDEGGRGVVMVVVVVDVDVVGGPGGGAAVESRSLSSSASCRGSAATTEMVEVIAAITPSDVARCRKIPQIQSRQRRQKMSYLNCGGEKKGPGLNLQRGKTGVL